jgi:hypothetical protein
VHRRRDRRSNGAGTEVRCPQWEAERLLGEKMIIREIINKKMRLVFWLILPGFVALVFGIVVIDKHIFTSPFFPIIALIGFLSVLIGILLEFLIQCPKCKTNIGQVIGSNPNWGRISEKLKVCPYCGTSFDSEI